MMEYPSQDSLASVKANQKVGKSAWENFSKLDSNHQGSSDASLFSSSLPVLPPCIMDSGMRICFVDDASSKLKDLDKGIEVNDSIEGLGLQGIGYILPEEDELFDSITSSFQSGIHSHVEQVEDCDLFSSGGGIELDTDPMEDVIIGMSRATIADGYLGNGNFQYNLPNSVGTFAGEHPYGEHPSRTLFVRNINSNIEDSELRSLFEQYGDIRSMYTHCKHRGFVMISYYDIRHARNAMRALQNKPLRRRKLDIHFSIPKDNPSDKDLNQGTLVAFNLDPSVSNDGLRQIFGAFGEVKEIRETPHKKHHKFIEYYDVRAAEEALRLLNKCDIAGKKIKLEPSRPGGARRNMIQQLSQEMEYDEMRSYRHQVGSPLTNSPPGTWAQFNSPVDNSPLRAFSHPPSFVCVSPVSSNHFPDVTSMVPPILSNSSKTAPIRKEQRVNCPEPLFSNSLLGMPFHHSHSFPECSGGLMPILSSSPCTMASSDSSASSASEFGTLTGPQFLWGSPNPRSEPNQSCAWSKSSLGPAATSIGQGHGFQYASHQGLHSASDHSVGSAPSGNLFEKHFGYSNESSDPSFMGLCTFGSMDICRNKGSLQVNSGVPKGPVNTVSCLCGGVSENASSGFRMMSSQRAGHIFLGSFPWTGPVSSGMEGFCERANSRRTDNNGGQLDSKLQFQLDIEKIISGEDTRTTLMIKNIPNKYTSKMLLAAIDENHGGTYDFLYLPIDFKNKCNVGYAFINVVSPSHIISFYQAFNGKKWEKFNSEKVASLAYARIQGKAALIAHFQNSSLMNEDKRCRPILFNSEGRVEDSDQEHLLANRNNPSSLQQDESFMNDSPAFSKNVDMKPDNSIELISGFAQE